VNGSLQYPRFGTSAGKRNRASRVVSSPPQSERPSFDQFRDIPRLGNL